MNNIYIKYTEIIYINYTNVNEKYLNYWYTLCKLKQFYF